MLKVSETQYDESFEVPSRKVGKDKTKCYYLKALFNTLVEFKPQYCIEIGTHTGITAKVFQKYFDNYKPDGLLVTCDIRKYVDLSKLKNVKQLIVAHHIPHIDKYHNIDKNSLKFSYENSIDINTSLLKNVVDEYDFAFIDGDHTRQSFLNDIKICENSLKSPKLMLLDDTKEPVHDCSSVYNDEIKTSDQYEYFDFYDQWSKFAGCSLIRRK